jgi:hypothetical protein
MSNSNLYCKLKDADCKVKDLDCKIKSKEWSIGGQGGGVINLFKSEEWRVGVKGVWDGIINMFMNAISCKIP